MSTIIVTGADAAHFINSRMLVASWWDTNRDYPLVYCDFGLTPDQVQEVRRWPVKYIARPEPDLVFTHAWRAKAALLRYVSRLEWDNLVWIDADALLLQSLGNVSALMRGYDLLSDAHRMAIGEITIPATRALLPELDVRDAYFSGGFWITSSRALLELWDVLCARVADTVNLWENDAFVAAVYSTHARVHTVCGSIWHVRGMTSIDTVESVDGVLKYAGIPCVVLHANADYTLRDDGRRVFKRNILRSVQDRWEARFLQLREGVFPHYADREE